MRFKLINKKTGKLIKYTQAKNALQVIKENDLATRKNSHIKVIQLAECEHDNNAVCFKCSDIPLI